MRVISFLLAVGIATVSCGSYPSDPPPPPAQDWPRFRGPNGSGVATGGSLPVEFGPERHLVWKTPLPPGHSSPVVSSNRVFALRLIRTLCSRSGSTARLSGKRKRLGRESAAGRAE